MTETTTDLVGRLTHWLSVLPPDQPRITTLIGELQTKFGERSGSVSAEVVTEIERLAWRHSRHLELSFVAEGGLSVDQESPGWDPDDVPSIRRRAANVSSVRRTEQGVAILALDGLRRPRPRRAVPGRRDRANRGRDRDPARPATQRRR